ncbi:MAG: TIGR01620 family protein, partial [Rhodobacterales bacterium]|nr:TIGR01620 family protein [Rhodobacterales bacterium]
MLELDSAADPSAAPPVPDILPANQTGGQAMQALAGLSQGKGSALTRFALWAFGALFTFVLSVGAWTFVADLLARNLILGWIAFALVAMAALAALILALREWGAYVRLARLDALRARAETAHVAADLPEARRVVKALERLYSTRPETAWGRARLAERQAEVMDADALLGLAERELMAPLDAESRAAVQAAARQVAMVTALVPLAFADVAMALVANLRMIRQIAEIYGGRAGSFGSLRLLRRVFTSLLAAGALALTDDMISSVAGGGVLSKLSRRFGEGVVNGALTARVGVAAIDLCRPLPFRALDRPVVSSLVSGALAGVFAKDPPPG